jgi:hypothetical protein
MGFLKDKVFVRGTCKLRAVSVFFKICLLFFHFASSDGEWEATTCEPLLRASVLVDLPRFHLLLSLTLHGFAALLLVVLPLHFLEFTGKTLNFILVLIDLSLVHVEFGSHGLHLVRLLLQILLVDGKLLSNLGAGLSCQ